MRLHEVSKFEPKVYKESTEKLLQYILTNCEPWLKASQGHPVYRGVKHYRFKDSVPNAFIRNTRLARRPKDSLIGFHKLFNTLIKIAGGVANRSNSIFVTGDQYEANNYGPVFAVFPMGNFNYTWSPEVTDWYADIEESGNHNLKDFLLPEVRRHIKFEPWEIIKNPVVFDPKNYIQSKVRRFILADRLLPDAIQDHREIMVKCESAVYVDRLVCHESLFDELRYHTETMWSTE